MLGFLILNLPSVLWDCQLDDRKGIWLAKLLRIYWYVGVGDLIGAWHVTTATSIISCCGLTFRYLLIQARLSWNTGCQSECCFCLHSEINRFYPIVMNIYIFQKKSKSLEWKLAGKFSNDERNVTKKLCLKSVSCCRNNYLFKKLYRSFFLDIWYMHWVCNQSLRRWLSRSVYWDTCRIAELKCVFSCFCRTVCTVGQPAGNSQPE